MHVFEAIFYFSIRTCYRVEALTDEADSKTDIAKAAAKASKTMNMMMVVVVL
jgi:hypothetical protein